MNLKYIIQFLTLQELMNFISLRQNKIGQMILINLEKNNIVKQGVFPENF